MSYSPNTLTLVADIGGTNTRVALCDGPRVLADTARKFRNADYPDLETVLQKYIADEGQVDPKGACIAVAGPVRNGSATLTNLPWKIDEATLAQATKAEKVAILNDLQAQGHALGHLDAAHIHAVLPGKPAEPDAPKLVIGVGTGFNATPVFDTPAGRMAAASECGHVNLPTRTDQDLRLAAYVARTHGFPSVEDALSGRGLENIYGFLSHEAGKHSDHEAAEIMAAYNDGSDPLATEAAAIFVRLLGAACGNLALTHLPFGGVYLVGGVARAFAPHLAEHGFAEAFRDKGRFSAFMDAFPVSVIDDDFAALTGSATYIANLLHQDRA